MLESIAKAVIDYSVIPTLIVGIYAVMVYKKLPREIKYFSWFIFLSCVVQLIASILFYHKQNNLMVLHFYTPVGFLFLIGFYNQIFDGLIRQKMLIIIGVLFLIYSVINSVFVQDIYSFNTYALSIEAILVVIFSLTSFAFLMNDIVRQKRTDIIRSINWINAGLFIYYSSSILVFYFGNIINSFSKLPQSKYIWSIYALFSVIMYLCFFIGLWKSPKFSNQY
jgi:hypothetical protein